MRIGKSGAWPSLVCTLSPSHNQPKDCDGLWLPFYYIIDMSVGCTVHWKDLFDNVDKDKVVLNSCPGRWDGVLQTRETQVRCVHLYQLIIYPLLICINKKIPSPAPPHCNRCQPSATLIPRKKSCCPPKTPPPPPMGSSESSPPPKGSSESSPPPKGFLTSAPPLGLRGSLILLLSGNVVAKALPVVLSDQPGEIRVDQVLRLGFCLSLLHLHTCAPSQKSSFLSPWYRLKALRLKV